MGALYVTILDENMCVKRAEIRCRSLFPGVAELKYYFQIMHSRTTEIIALVRNWNFPKFEIVD